MVEEQGLSILTPIHGYRDTCSLSEFTGSLMPNLLSSKELGNGWVFWSADINQQSEIKQKIVSAMEAMVKESVWLLQFWAAVVDVDGQHHYLTTYDQPFCVSALRKGFCWYRKRCMDPYYYYVVENGAKEEELGPIGRVYRNKRPESSPDLRLYTTTEFPLRDHAARCGLRQYLALPVFDLHKNDCYGVLELLSFDEELLIGSIFQSSFLKLQQAGLRSAHFHSLDDMESMEPKRGDVSKMLELAIKAVTQLHMAHVWVPCKQCPNFSCMERATFIYCGCEKVNSFSCADNDMIDYLIACKFHNLQVGKGIAKSLMSSNSTSCFYRNICDLNIIENPLAHYAQRARLSLCFAVCLQSVDDSNDICVAEFFLQSNSRQDACGDSFLHLLLRIMGMELQSYKFSALGQRLGVELAVELIQPIAIQYESVECKGEITHQYSEELSTFVLMEGHRKIYSELNFQKYLQTADLCCLQSSKEDELGWPGWVFCRPDREELYENNLTSNSSFVSNMIKEKIIVLMKELHFNLLDDSYNLVQFWAPKMEENRRYLATLAQPFALGGLHKGLASFRKRCMKRQYFVDEEAKEEELGPPGRAFRNGHPEISCDLRLYSTREFSLRNDAVHCALVNYVALPLFHLNHPHECLGVLEFVGHSYSTEALNYFLGTILHSLHKANLSSTHFHFQPSFQITESRKLALTEILNALDLISEIPQLHMTEVWVPYSECASINSDVSCMVLAEARGTKVHFYDEEITDMRYVPTLPQCEVHAPTNKAPFTFQER